MIFDLVLVFILIGLNAFFVISEFSMVRVRSSLVEIKANEGHLGAKIVQKAHNNMNAYLSATQLGITLSSLALGWIGEEAASDIITKLLSLVGVDRGDEIAEAVTVPVSFFFITFLHIVLGEQLPKTMGIQHSDKVSFAIATPMQLFYSIFRPFIWVLNSVSNILIKAIGGTPLNIHEEHTTEELKMLIDKGVESGAIHEEEHELIENVFQFNETTAKQIMVPRTKMIALEASTSDEAIMQLIEQEGFSRMPVFKGTIDDVVGIISTKDILRMASKGETIILSNHLRPAYFIPETKKIGALLKDFQKKRLQMAVVIDEFGGTAGIVTLEDVIEELVGEIRDEDDDEEKSPIERVSDVEYLVNGTVQISEANDVLRYPLPESDNYETISGLVQFVFGKIPELNEEKEFAGYNFKVTQIDKKTVAQVKIIELLKKDD